MSKARDEDAFMADLLAGLDDSFFNAVPSPDPSPKKERPEASLATADTFSVLTSTSGLVGQYDTPKTTVGSAPEARDENFDQLLEGAEDWDWNDMNDDFLSPKKVSPKKRSPVVCIKKNLHVRDGP